MASRRESSQTIYPFTPSALSYASLLAGIKDATLLVSGVAATLPFAGDFTGGVRWSYLRSVSVSPSGCIYVFCSVEYSDASENLGRVHTFSVTSGQGVVRVSDGLSWLVVDSNQIPTSPTALNVLNPPAPLEPCRTQWRTRRATKLQLFNEYRNHNPQDRGSLPADTLVKSYSIPNSTVKLKDGWNCSLAYDEDLETLYITGGAGEGRGLPSIIPWDTAAPDVNTGIVSINGLLGRTGNVDMRAGGSLILQTAPAILEFTVREELEA